MVGPFIFLDIMGPERLPPRQVMEVDAHPHIGLSTLTYLLDGRLVHRDSTGAVQPIEPGAVNWMTAGSGVTHTERSHPNDRPSQVDMFGAQIWVALPDDAEDQDPGFEHCPADEIPSFRDGSTSVRVAAGSGWSLDAPVRGSSPLVLAEVRLDDSSLAIPADQPERAVLSLRGNITVADRPLAAGSLAVLEPDGRPRISGSGTALVLGGDPIGRRHIWWNFVHSDPDRIEAAKEQWQSQTFPLVPDDHDPFVPLPGS